MRSALLALAAASMLQGCATMSRLGGAMRDAAAEPLTWAPVATGAALVATGADRSLTEWARDETPLFGSTIAAESASDDLLDLTLAGWAIATLAAPSPEDDAVYDKFRSLGIGYAGIYATGVATGGLKGTIERDRPDGSDDRSFPSGHAAPAAAAATLGAGQAHRRLDRGAARSAVDAAFFAASFGTGWARVEAGKHYVSDVLAGYSLGRFVGRATELAFLDPEAPVAVIVSLDGVWVSVSW